MGFFHSGDSSKTSHHNCVACPKGLACDTPGLNTSTVVVEPDFWRTTRDSLAILFCRTGWCVGGFGAGDILCEEGHAGPRCGLCLPDYFKSITGACQPCKQTAVGLSVGLIVAGLIFIVIVWKCVIARLGKWARRRLRAFGKTMFVFVQIVVTLPGIIQMPILPVFVELMKILKIPALDLLLENLGLACVVDTDHFLQLMAMTALPPVLVLLVFVRNLCVTGFNARDAAGRTTGPALIIVYAVFPISAATVFNTFMTESFDDGNERLAYDLSFDVSDSRYPIMFNYAVLMVSIHQRPSFIKTRSPRFDFKNGTLQTRKRCKTQ